ncbi:hypothetical protein BKA00_005781 [Actinomadura coerulea]|uniref:Uncharacterized protein n=1 Tax=Actinomadura coerulea TaxID=46159 RepID=A0A7X0L1U3_9ACTN|nr:hypothetical protein [Actinomadura coerulea]
MRLVGIRPGQSRDLGSTQPAEGDQVEEDVQPLVRDDAEEGARLGRRPDHHLAGHLSGRPGTLSTLAQAANVTTDQAVGLLDQLLRSGIIAGGEA